VKRMLFTPWDEEKGNEQPIPPVEMVGGKGHGLYWLAINRFPVPPTWVLSTAAFDMVVQRARLMTTIAKIEKAVAGLANDWAKAQQALEALEPQRTEVVDALRHAAMPDRVGAALSDLPLAPAQWAVRSSATVEDDPRHTFAGQFLSLLSVPQGIALWDAIRQVWASTFGRAPLLYCTQNEAPLPRMAVALQPMEPITARDRSGVAFSHSPVDALPGVLTQTAFGTGQVVVGGYGGDIYSVNGEQAQAQPMPPAEIRVTGAEGYTVPQSPPSGFALTEKEARELARLVLAVAERWNGPVNVEFVWRQGEGPTLVQVRSAR
jgi:phosphoenolpyruvate synthase/pyruvate phosphate dikinase